MLTANNGNLLSTVDAYNVLRIRFSLSALFEQLVYFKIDHL